MAEGFAVLPHIDLPTDSQAHEHGFDACYLALRLIFSHPCSPVVASSEPVELALRYSLPLFATSLSHEEERPKDLFVDLTFLIISQFGSDPVISGGPLLPSIGSFTD